MNVPNVILKGGVKINGRHFDPEIRRILDVARLTAPALVGDLVVTSANDSKHKDGSKHFTNEAFDIRVRNIRGFKWGPRGDFMFNEAVEAWVRRMRLELGDDYDVIYGDEQHIDHIHIERDISHNPKKT